LRDRRIWKFAATNVTGLTITVQGQARKLMRNAAGQWAQTPGTPALDTPLAMALEETLHRLGELQVEVWTDQGEDKLARYGFAQAAHKIAIQANVGGKSQLFTLDFGLLAPSHNVYAATLVDGIKLVFEFRLSLYQHYQDVLRGVLALPPAATPAK
jgi:hypothetical protein